MFGLLDSVKQAVELKRSHDHDMRARNHDYGEIAAVPGRAPMSRDFKRTPLLLLSELDQILEDQRKQSRDKSSSSRPRPLKHLRPQCHRSPPSPVTQPFSLTGGSPYAQLAVDPQLLNSQRLHTKSSRRSRDQRDGVVRPGQEAREAADRTVTEPHARAALCDAEKAAFGRKKRKSK